MRKALHYRSQYTTSQTVLRAEWEHSLKEAIFNLVAWVRENRDRGIDQIMAEFDDLFINVRS